MSISYILPINTNYLSRTLIPVVTQYYEAEVVSEYVIRGNTAVLKCNIPSFVADFVKVEAWVNSDGGEYLPTDDIGSSDAMWFYNYSLSLTFFLLCLDFYKSYTCHVFFQLLISSTKQRFWQNMWYAETPLF